MKVVNVKSTTEKYEYVGRSPRHGGPSPLGNPYRIGPDGSRFDVVEMYRDWLHEIIRAKEGVEYTELQRLAEIAKNDNLILGCHCSPEKCHADMIAAAVMYLNR